MSYRDFLLAPIEAPGSPERSAVESRRFGLSVGRLHVSPRARYGVEALVEAIDSSDFDVVILRYPAERIEWFGALARGRRRPLFADSVHVLQLPLPSQTGPDPEAAGARFERVDHESFPSFVRALGPAFKDHTPHYAANPWLPSVPAEEVYEGWMRALLDVPDARVVMTRLGDDPEPVGFFAIETYELDGRRGEYHIIGTLPGLRRGHVGTLSADEGHRQLHAMGCDASLCLVRVSNVASLNLVLSLGYRPILTVNTLHLIHPRLLERRGRAGAATPA